MATAISSGSAPPQPCPPHPTTPSEDEVSVEDGTVQESECDVVECDAIWMEDGLGGMGDGHEVREALPFHRCFDSRELELM